MRLTIEMDNPAQVIMEELTRPGITQASLAITYAFCIAQEPETVFPAINAAIQRRYRGKTALARIKEAAWKHVEGWTRRGRA